MDKLAVFNDIERRLTTIQSVDEAKAIRDQAEALRVYAKSAKKGLVIQNRMARIKIRAEQRAGMLIAAMERHQGARDGRPGLLRTLRKSEIRPDTAHYWQTMATISGAQVDRLEMKYTKERRELTSLVIFRLGRQKRILPPPAAVPTPGFAWGPWRTIIIDPPWPVEKIILNRRPVERERMDYSTWSLERIRDFLPIKQLADSRGAHVYLWVTHHFLPFGLECFAAWGVRYECILTWYKPTAQPLWWKYNTEHVLFGKIGTLVPLVKGTPTGFQAPQQRHSHKPEEFYRLVRRVSPHPRYTLFDTKRKGFKEWGKDHVAH